MIHELDLYPKFSYKELFPKSLINEYYGTNLAFSNGDVSVVFRMFILWSNFLKLIIIDIIDTYIGLETTSVYSIVLLFILISSIT